MIVEDETREAAGVQITKSLTLLALIRTLAFAVNEMGDHGGREVGDKEQKGLMQSQDLT